MPSMKQISLFAATTPSRPAVEPAALGAPAAAAADGVEADEDDTACVMEPRDLSLAARFRAVLQGSARGRRWPGLMNDDVDDAKLSRARAKRASRATISAAGRMRQFTLWSVLMGRKGVNITRKT